MFYTTPVLHDYGCDLSKKWRIEWFESDVPITSLRNARRKVEYISIRLTTASQRYRVADQIIEQIKVRLQGGNNGETSLLLLTKALTDAKTYKIQNCKSAMSRKNFDYAEQQLTAWLKENNLTHITVEQFSKQIATKFVTEAFVKKGLQNRTINGYVSYIKSLFQHLADNEFIAINPFGGIKKLRTQETSIRIWTNEEIRQLANYCRENEPQFFIVVLLVFQSFLRMQEILKIQIKDIDLVRGVITIPAEKGKSNKNKYPTLSKQVIELLTPIVAANKKNTDYYLFASPTMECGAKQFDRKYLSQKFEKIRRRAKLPDDLQLYSLKHTGNSQMLERGATLEELMLQNGHSEARTTQLYIRRLTIKANEKFRNQDYI